MLNVFDQLIRLPFGLFITNNAERVLEAGDLTNGVIVLLGVTRLGRMNNGLTILVYHRTDRPNRGRKSASTIQTSPDLYQPSLIN